jgi:hypothetical protein
MNAVLPLQKKSTLLKMAEQLGQQQTNQGLALHQSQQRNLQ